MYSLPAQPDEAVYLKMNVKSPGLKSRPLQAELDVTYKSRFEVCLLISSPSVLKGFYSVSLAGIKMCSAVKPGLSAST